MSVFSRERVVPPWLAVHLQLKVASLHGAALTPSTDESEPSSSRLGTPFALLEPVIVDRSHPRARSEEARLWRLSWGVL